MVGELVVFRRYFSCQCGQSLSPMDAWAGIGSRSISEHVRRVITLAGSAWSFDKAALKLKGLCQLTISNDTVRAVCNEEGERAGQWLRKDAASASKLSQAKGGTGVQHRRHQRQYDGGMAGNPSECCEQA